MKTRLFLTVLLIASAAQAQNPKVVGWVENVMIEDVDITLKAKLDTGAKTSSIDAEVIDIRKEGKRIRGKYTGEVVVFSVKDTADKSNTFERKIVRYVRIKKKNGGYLRRPVIEMAFCIAGRLVKEEVNLANRENFIYPVLVGRNMMQHADLAVDPARTFVSNPRCIK
jgi:hypothetical protein